MIHTEIPNEELEVFKYLKDIKVVFDVGAREDLDYLVIKPEIELHAFEPNPVYFGNLIKKNIKNSPNVYLNNFGLSDKNGTFDYFEMSESFEVNPTFPPDVDKTTFKYETKRLDDYIKEKNIKCIDFLKVDTEGYDYKVLLGGEEAIKITRYIQFEYWDGVRKFVDLLKGFAFYLMVEPKLREVISFVVQCHPLTIPTLVPLDEKIIDLIDKYLIPAGAGGNILCVK